MEHLNELSEGVSEQGEACQEPQGVLQRAPEELPEFKEALTIMGQPQTQVEVEDPRVVEQSRPLWYCFAEKGIAFCGLLLLAPVFAAIGTILLFQRQGSVFYTQTRVGKGGRLFTIYKFRTMGVDAESSGPFICTTYDDPRITNVGRFLRKSKLDELPQLINIIRGEMSFVGPRPERPHFHYQFSGIPNWEQRISVTPGLTGLAQASKWIAHDPEEKLAADLAYISNRSVSLDVQIVLYTLFPSRRPKTLCDMPMG